jgi:hypothetical protein
MFTLIAMGTGVAWAYSMVRDACAGSSRWRSGRPGAVPAYFEAAAVITVLVLLGQLLEPRETTSGAIRALLDLSPKLARRVRTDGADEEITLDAVLVGELRCGFALARRCRQTAWSSTAARDRRVDGDQRVHARDQGSWLEADRRRSTRLAACSCVRQEDRARHHALADRPDGRRYSSAAVRRSSG